MAAMIGEDVAVGLPRGTAAALVMMLGDLLEEVGLRIELLLPPTKRLLSGVIARPLELRSGLSHGRRNKTQRNNDN
jgi:hypothetical protein